MGSMLMGTDKAATYNHIVCALNSRLWWPLVGNWGGMTKCRNRKCQAVWNVLHESPLAGGDVPIYAGAVCKGSLRLAQRASVLIRHLWP